MTYNPGDPGIKNDAIFGFPFTEETSQLVLLPVPWDVTCSYGAGTANGPSAILRESSQIDFFDQTFPNVWEKGIYMYPIDSNTLQISNDLRGLSEKIIAKLESDTPLDATDSAIYAQIETAAEVLTQRNATTLQTALKAGKKIGLIGGDHSTSLGAIQAVASEYPSFGILHIDSHMDLRLAYEGFKYSHASIMRNALDSPSLTKLVQVGINDCSHEEYAFAEANSDRVTVFSDESLFEQKANGLTWKAQCEDIIQGLPEHVYISVDIDGLLPELAPHTGTPTGSGLSFQELQYLIKFVVKSGRNIVGFDLVETGNHAYDAVISSKILYILSVSTLATQRA
jgi:agmatinase